MIRRGEIYHAPAGTMNCAPTFFNAFKFWLKLGFISFGGPAGQIAIMHKELVEEKKWLSEKRFLHALNYCMVLPGPEAQQLATYIGWLMHKTWGGIVAGVLFVLPSLFILILLSWIYIACSDVPAVTGLFYGIKPAVAAIVAQAVHRIGSRSLKNNWHWSIAAASFIAIFALHLPFPLIILVAALIGYVGGKIAPEKFQSSAHADNGKSYGAAIIDDHTPTPEHARFHRLKLFRVLAAGGLLWLLPMALLIACYGWQHTYAQLAWFFTQAALLTFGGAYAVLPYVYQGAVENYQWLNGSQMIDGLALGETTPGPLIMVVAFVGFLAAYLQELMGSENLFLAGALGAVIVAWFTFLPSFIFIFSGAPFIETTHNNLKFTAALTAITAAVVGVILNLALFFAYHVLWPSGFEATFDVISAAIALIAVLALFRYKRGVMETLALCAMIGLVIKLIL